MGSLIHPRRSGRWTANWIGAIIMPIMIIFHPVPAMAADTRYGSLPPPPMQLDMAAEQRLELELIVNGLSGLIVPVIKQGPRFRLDVQDLRRAGMLLDTSVDALFLDSLEGVAADYDAPRQQLHLTVSPQYLPDQRISREGREAQKAQYDSGALLNYDLYVSGGGAAGQTQASLGHELRIFGPLGLISTTAVLRAGAGKSYARLDSYWRRSDQASMTTMEAGDFITRSLPWAPAVRLGGVQFSRDFSVRPDVITYPLPEFSGSAALPSTVDLVIQGQRVAGAAVNPGPFLLDTLPPINGYGEANLVVTDMVGRNVSAAMPFYISSALLRPGLTDYAVAIGAFRRNYGVRNFDYGDMAASASARHGISGGMTLEARAELAGDMRLIGGGAVVKLRHYGVLSAAYSRSFQNGKGGGELMLGYDYQTRGFSIGLRHNRRDRDYSDLGLLDRGKPTGWEHLSSATASLSLRRAGTFGIGYFDLQQENGQDARFANVAWSVPIWKKIRLYTSLSRDFAERKWTGALTLSVSLGGGSASAGVARRENGDMMVRADYARSAPVTGGFGWNASVADDGAGTPYWRGEVQWRSQPVQLRAGAYGQKSVTGWFGASGSLVFMDDALFAANRVSDAFAVVSTNGEPGVPVRYENQLIGTTNGKGHILLPSVSAYYPGLYEIDTLSLSANVHAPLVSQRVAVAAGSGHVIAFPVEHKASGRATVRNREGAPLPAGAIATINGDRSTYIGWDGLLYIERLMDHNRVDILLPGGEICHLAFAAKPDPGSDKILELGDLACQP